MSLSVALNTATSGLLAAQTGIRTVSDNIANINTPGYVRKTLDQQPLAVNGMGMGVEVTGVKRVTDQYLQLASLTASSDAGRYDVLAQYLDNAQSLFGDPSSDSFFFTRLDSVFSAFAAAADDPSSSLTRSQAIFNVQDFLSEAGRINTQINDLGKNLDTQINSDVDRSNSLLEQINKLNVDISRAKLVGADASGSQNIQSQLIDELSTLMNVRVAERDIGGVTIRSTEGVMLAGDGPAKLTYNRTGASRGYVTALPAGAANAQAIQITSGEIRGLLDLRDTELPELSQQLGEFVSRASEQINSAHNAATAVPAPATLTGRNTGLDLPTIINGFTGKSSLAVVDSTGKILRRVDVDFGAQSASGDGGATNFSFAPPADFATALTNALGGMGTATFANGALSISANGGNGVALAPPAEAGVTPTADNDTSKNRAGKTFGEFFGLNDLIRSSSITSYETGLNATDPHGFTAGGQIKLRLAQSDGKPLADVTVSIPAASTMNDLLLALNSTATGVGLYGQFQLDSKGALNFTGSVPLNANLSVLTDTTQRGVGGPSVSELFGLGQAQQSARAGAFKVDPAIVSAPTKLGLAQLDLSVGVNGLGLRPGDGTGARRIAQAGDTTTAFQAAGSLGAVNMTVSRYAAEFGGSIGRNAASAETQKSSAESVKTEAVARRQSVEGVNLDEELVRLTTYQQAFSASARLIQATKDMFDVLTQMI